MKRQKTPFKLLLIVAVILPLFLALLIREPAPLEGQIRFAVDPAFMLSYNGLSALEELYNVEFPTVYELAIGLTHEALRQKDVDIGMGFTTDGKMKELDLIALKDDLGFFPANNPALVVRRDALEKHPQIPGVIHTIVSKLHADTMIHLNYAVDIEERDPFDVALDWLLEHNLLPKKQEIEAEATPLIIGSMLFTEHQVLSSLIIMALKYEGIPIYEKTYLLQTDETYRSHLLAGDIDMYWEYLRRGWGYLFEEKEDLNDTQEVFLELARKDAENEIIWLDYAPFSSSYTIIMRKEHAKDLGITTLSELAQWLERREEK